MKRQWGMLSPVIVCDAYESDYNMIVGVTYVADGCEPISHGPYEFVLSK